MLEDRWCENAVVYNLDLEAFINASGVGNFDGLTQCSDYTRDVAVKIL